ncbi:hypothetical protein RHMOL_Rhmol10G0150800 [Rhododendron molle]|uniref:Uncharacterized protein n=1 Tax=Rhododendron molle TaxID=49168 RepID=A0ACC0M453_RHOML|nr:hypothetical protein RHMOL_Rhmol10G0150800 [Rhododendron molle]
MHVVRWDEITRKKSNGGLGVKKLAQQNLALLAKWWWRFGKDKEALWVKVIKGKYGLDANCWLPYIRVSGSSSRIWRDICSLDSPSSRLVYSIRDSFRAQVNSGDATMFWEHVWLGESALKEDYPRLFSLSTQKEVLISTLRTAGSWDLLFRRDMFGREKQEMENLKARLQLVVLNPLKPDSLQWRWTGDGIFPVKSAYAQWELQNHSSCTLLGSLWKNLAPPKVEIFAWMAVKERAVTRSVLLSRNLINDIHLALCPLCSLHLETHQHLFLHCHFSWNVWSIILDWWNIKWVCPISVPDLAQWWFTNGFFNLEKYVWEICFYATLWSLWLVRNDTIFNNSSKQAWEVGDLVITRVAMWIKAKFDIKVYSIEEFKIFLDGVRKLRV